MPKKYPVISVIIPVFNRRDKILTTIKSLNAQIYPNIEIIIVDDGSTDDTLKIRDYQQEITKIEQEIKNLKGVTAFNLSKFLRNANKK